jgi:hypothetical protein
MNETPVSTVQHAGPFMVDWLREAIRSHAGRYCAPLDRELVKLTTLLNMVDGAYKSSTNLRFAIEVRYALWVLMRFFDERGPACEKAGGEKTELDPRIINLVNEIEAHARAIGMNAGGMMQPYESWRDFDLYIGHAFKMALEASNPGKKIGFTNTGPIARLTNEAIRAITGRAPGVYNVGQHLKQPYRKKEKLSRRTR